MGNQCCFRPSNPEAELQKDPNGIRYETNPSNGREPSQPPNCPPPPPPPSTQLNLDKYTLTQFFQKLQLKFLLYYDSPTEDASSRSLHVSPTARG